MAREDLDAVGQLEQSPERVEEPIGPFAGLDGQVGTGGVADEQRVAGQHQPRLGGARAVDDRQAAVLRPVTGRVQAAQHDAADLELGAVLERIVLVARLGGRVDAHRHVVLERQPAVPGEVVGVRVRLDRPDEADAAPPGLLEVLLDRVGRVDDHRDPGVLVADQVRGAAEIVVDELREDHCGGS